MLRPERLWLVCSGADRKDQQTCFGREEMTERHLTRSNRAASRLQARFRVEVGGAMRLLSPDVGWLGEFPDQQDRPEVCSHWTGSDQGPRGGLKEG